LKLATPRWWYQSRAPKPVLRALLKPASWVWAAATARRIAKGGRANVGAPVICVGNLTMGGAGKTPIVRAIAERLADSGLKAQVLSRGHGARITAPIKVDPRLHTAEAVGDEPLMLAQDLTVWVSPDRLAGASAAVADGAAVIVMDDGHQNASLAKALSIIVVDGETRDGEWPFGDGAVFPAGPMREPLARGLARADAVVVLMPPGLAQPDPRLLAQLVAKPVLVAHLEPYAKPPRGPVIAFAGIGKPWKFERALKDAGANLASFTGFPDHGAYDEAILARLADQASEAGATLVTTEKDWARLPADWRKRITAWPVAARFEDEAALDALLRRALSLA